MSVSAEWNLRRPLIVDTGVVRMTVLALVSLVALALACGDPADDPDDGTVNDGCAHTCTPAPSATAELASTVTPPAATSTAVRAATATPGDGVASPPPPSGTGVVEGYVHIGPTCPVVREGEDCDDRPYEADLDVFDTAGTLMTTLHAGADGNFSASLPPGSYRLVPRNDGRFPFAGEQEFVVEEGRVTEIDVPYDSGIR
jgi:hypothetical protein